MADMLVLEWFINNVCQTAVKQEGLSFNFIINCRESFKLIVLCNYHASQSISKFTLRARTEPLYFKGRTFHQSFHIRMDCFTVLKALWP